jgi:hypothetical protein
VTLSHDAVLKVLQTRFVCGFKNITGEPYAGKSGRHDPDSPAVLTTNGAGPHNVQIFFLSADGTVLHCLPGYWCPADLLAEMQFALGLERVWKNPALTAERKMKLAWDANRRAIVSRTLGMQERSRLQGFDAKEERKKADSDFKYRPGDYRGPVLLAGQRNDADLKTVDQVAHERMAARPFVPYEGFDVEKFTDYGKLRYDKHEAGPRVSKRK